MAVVAFISFRLGLTDGVSVVAESWRRIFQRLGWETITVAGQGPVDYTVEGLELGATHPPNDEKLRAVLAGADLVVVENLLTIPMNLPASRAVAKALAGRRAILHHHDPPWQRARFAHITELPATDPHWLHITINHLTEAEFAVRNIKTTTIYNGFDTSPTPGDRESTRARLGVGPDERLFFHPVRAIERKNIPVAIDLCQRHNATYWIPGPAEDGYQTTLDQLLANARCPIVTTPIDRQNTLTMADGYAACDLVVFPSTWEGFGNPPVEAAIVGKPAVVSRYPVADELRDRLGFVWPEPDDHQAIEEAMERRSGHIIDHNQRVAERSLSMQKLQKEIIVLLDRAGWKP